MFVERKINGVWEKVSETEAPQHPYFELAADDRTKEIFSRNAWATGRNYALFGVLASVRSKQFEAMIHPRGLPSDLSEDVKKDYNEANHHTPSFYSLKELLSFKDQGATATFFLNMTHYKKYKKEKKIDFTKEDYYIRVPGGSNIVSVEKMDRLEKFALFGDEDDYITRVDYAVPHVEISSHFWEKIVPAMQRLSDDPENVRLTFWFDN